MNLDRIEQYIQRNFSEWIPMERIGLLYFDKPLPNDLEGFEFRKDHEASDPSDDWDCFKLYDPTEECMYEELTVTVEDNKTIVVSCDKFLYYKGTNIIGLPIHEALQTLGNPEYYTEEFEVIDAWKTIYEVDELELSIWVNKDIVENVACYGFTED
ncbi:hypothetical protein DPQ33_04835 [Oceanidesulfovibrio indonesiensis]|uniref:Uncharacterized protein n=2 Tax=Oceanidesulfovibrio indonesiensis TaxID=54767 RepID=A0A7M3MI06_9BACT|nr:hypothetical protein DPQ33_04835 [Oceanidesulfovibrio indonesiensis]